MPNSKKLKKCHAEFIPASLKTLKQVQGDIPTFLAGL